ncbi:MAG TPA: CNP1-like family protein [Paraburkholderia sp.]|nr:CNP1-like family protein [Paraburkholderia sp.]
MKRIALVAGCVAAGVLLAACAGSKTPSNKDDGTFKYLLDRAGPWTENKVTSLPPLPQPGAHLLPFDVSNNTSLTFAVDPASVSVGSDGVVRYTIVITTPTGGRNVNYEGIRCETYEWRLYASLNADHDGWDETVANDWERIQKGTLNAYHSALYTDYFCANKMPAGNTHKVVDDLRYGRTQSSQMH